jgi:O-methyltransferase
MIRASLLKLWRTPGLNRLFNVTLPYAPRSLRARVERERGYVRQSELEARIHTRVRLVPEAALHALLMRGLRTLVERHGRERVGDYLEFGVYNGSSLLCMFGALRQIGLDYVRLFGFDSFQGFPPNAAHEDEGRWQPGRCFSPLEFTRAVLEEHCIDPTRVTLVPGWFTDTLNNVTREQHRISKASVIMIDCDLYSSTKEALHFCAPLIQDEALLLFDEYYPRGLEHKNLGERRAFDEFLQETRCFEAEPFQQYAPRTQTFFIRRVG